ncbi:hypothetical protein ACNS7O_18595 (plasmid) [Haloferacaceae archaeon DSL9]
MTSIEDLFEKQDATFEESIRIDRKFEEDEDRAAHRDQLYRHYLDTYHITEASENYLEDFFARIHGHDEEMRKGANHWLYGYYGSGKSHLLTVLNLLTASADLEEEDREEVWNRLDSDGSYTELFETWSSMLDEYRLVPLPINLLKYQSVREQSFSEIILQAVYQARGLSNRLDVAFFEEWYQNQGTWDQRDELTKEILQDEDVPNAQQYSWDDVQQYRILSDLVLEELVERETGTADGLADIQRQDIGQRMAVEAVEAYRQELEAESEKPVKIALLVDEVTLFIGGNYQRLSELNALAESIDTIGDGDIQMVATAQSEIEDVRPGLAAKQLDFGILKDRFPHQYHLPSHHVGEIVQRRLLEKTEEGADWVESEALTARVHPTSTFVYSEVGQNTEPPLNRVDEDKFVKFYPLLPYQPALFLEILSNLRNELADSTKSIFSGTARAILAIVAGLRDRWMRDEKKDELSLISLVDFYDLIQYELEDIIPNEIEVLEEIEDDEDTTDFDLKVAKAVLLLSYVPDSVPQNDANIAVAVMDDLNGQPRTTVRNQVQNSLENLDKYIRPNTAEDGPLLRITDREEREIIEEARKNRENPDWDEIIAALDDELWADIRPRLNLPTSVPYGGDGDNYPISYSFSIDGQPLDGADEHESALEASVVIRGVRPDIDSKKINEGTIYWSVKQDGLDDLRSQLIEWWSFHKATAETETPDTIARDVDDAAERVKSKLASALKDGSFKVESQEPRGLESAVKECINRAYPSFFHPVMLEVYQSYLTELKRLSDDEEYPEWAQKIDVPTPDAEVSTMGTIAKEVRGAVGRTLVAHDNEMGLPALFEKITEETPFYGEVKPAVTAVLWGLCRAGEFRPVAEDGEALAADELLTLSQQMEIKLRTAPSSTSLKEQFIDAGIIDPIQTVDEGIVALEELNESMKRRARTLAETTEVSTETELENDALVSLVAAFSSTLSEMADAAESRAEAITGDDTDWEKVIDQVASDEEWISAVEERWDSREPYLLQLDGLLRFRDLEIEWLSQSFYDALNQLTQQLNEESGREWWTQEGWQSFDQSLDARLTAIAALEEDWSAQVAETDAKSLATELEGHEWLIPPLQLPEHSVHDGFQSGYLRPLRHFRDTHDDIQACVSALTNREPGTHDERALKRALGTVSSTTDWDSLTEDRVGTYREKYETVEQLVGGTRPDEIEGVGVLFGDESALKGQFERIVKSRKPTIEQVDGGVVIK